MKKLLTIILCFLYITTLLGCIVNEYSYVDEHTGKEYSQVKNCNVSKLHLSEGFGEHFERLSFKMDIDFVADFNKIRVVRTQTSYCPDTLLNNQLDINEFEKFICGSLFVRLNFENDSTKFRIDKEFYCYFDSSGLARVSVEAILICDKSEVDMVLDHINDDIPVYVNVKLNFPGIITSSRKDFKCDFGTKFKRIISQIERRYDEVST